MIQDKLKKAADLVAGPNGERGCRYCVRNQPEWRNGKICAYFCFVPDDGGVAVMPDHCCDDFEYNPDFDDAEIEIDQKYYDGTYDQEEDER